MLTFYYLSIYFIFKLQFHQTINTEVIEVTFITFAELPALVGML